MTPLLVMAGCARIPSGVHVQSIQGEKRFSEKYPSAYVVRGNGGDYHIVLLKDGATRPRRETPGRPLKPLDLADVRQVLHVHALWRPMPMSKPDSPSAINSVLDWYLVRAGADGQVQGLAHYQGAGFVTVSAADDEAGVIIRSATLHPVRVTGDIADPIGAMHMTGRFDAAYRPALARDVLAQVDKLKEGEGVDALRLTEPAAAAR